MVYSCGLISISMKKEQRNFIEKIAKHWFLRNLFNSDVATFIGCQFALESNFGSSRLATFQNNFCGMKTPSKRVFYGVSNLSLNGGFACYSSLDFCVVDYCSWVLYNRPKMSDISSVENYSLWLENKNYCPEKDYIKKIVSLFNSYNNVD